jgi:hypothetical protein
MLARGELGTFEFQGRDPPSLRFGIDREPATISAERANWLVLRTHGSWNLAATIFMQDCGAQRLVDIK